MVTRPPPMAWPTVGVGGLDLEVHEAGAAQPAESAAELPAAQLPPPSCPPPSWPPRAPPSAPPRAPWAPPPSARRGHRQARLAESAAEAAEPPDSAGGEAGGPARCRGRRVLVNCACVERADDVDREGVGDDLRDVRRGRVLQLEDADVADRVGLGRCPSR